MKHDELVERAGKWLRSTAKCKVVLTEFVTYANEIPDAIGWNHRKSILIECKASRADFLSDKNKTPRKYPEQCMGNFRFYMTPPGLVSPAEILDGWGLLEVHPKRVIMVGWPDGWGRHDKPLRLGIHGLLNERMMMFSALRRMEIRGYLKHAKDPLPGMEGKNE